MIVSTEIGSRRGRDGQLDREHEAIVSTDEKENMDMEGDIIALGKMGHTYVHGRGKARARKDYAQAKYKRGATNLSDDRVEARVVGANTRSYPGSPESSRPSLVRARRGCPNVWLVGCALRGGSGLGVDFADADA